MTENASPSPAHSTVSSPPCPTPADEKLLERPWNRLLWFDELDSTQRWALRAASLGRIERGSVVWAERQTAGCGRQGNQWDSSLGGLYVTVTLPYELPIERQHLGCVSLLAAMACVEALHESLGLDARIKWPNDIYLQGRKLAGLLGEVTQAPPPTHHDGEAARHGEDLVLIGLGLNWMNRVTEDALTGGYSAISVFDVRPDVRLGAREAFLATWLRRIDGWHARLCRSSRRGLIMLTETVETVLWGKGETVRFERTEQGAVEGVLLGLAHDGAARLQLGHEIREVHCGCQSPDAGNGRHE